MNQQDNQIVLFQSQDGRVHLEVNRDEKTVWLRQEQIAELFDKDVSGISRHISKIFNEGELDPTSNLQKMQFTGIDKPINFYSLDVVLAVGYRASSRRATEFRIWASSILKEYIIKGFAMDDERLKQLGGGGYWKELLDRIRDIRSSEKVIYRQVLDIYATAVDYDPRSMQSIEFFKIVQNKLHFAAHGHTASEVIYSRADAEKDFMGMTSFKGSWPTLRDAQIAKNYLSADELKILNNIVSGYFDFAEVQALRHIPTYMSDYIQQLDNILSSSGNKLLPNAGSVSHEQAMEKAEQEYRKWQVNSLSPVEVAYLDSIKELGQKITTNPKELIKMKK